MLHQIIRSWCTASPLQTVPNVTAHPSTAGVPITVLLYDDPLLCGFKVAIKGLRFGINGDINKDIMQHTGCAFNKRTAVRKVYSRHSGQYTCQFITTNTALRSFFLQRAKHITCQRHRLQMRRRRRRITAADAALLASAARHRHILLP